MSCPFNHEVLLREVHSITIVKMLLVTPALRVAFLWLERKAVRAAAARNGVEHISGVGFRKSLLVPEPAPLVVFALQLASVSLALTLRRITYRSLHE